jgi:alpha,alpha-trehalase
MESEFSPRAEYGVVHPLLVPEPGGINVHGGAALLRLSSPVEADLAEGTARMRFAIGEGETLEFALSEFEALARRYGWKVDALWSDERGWFGIFLLGTAPR